MPETLQKLHESSQSLEQNQTAISRKINEVQQHIENVEKEVRLKCHFYFIEKNFLFSFLRRINQNNFAQFSFLQFSQLKDSIRKKGEGPDGDKAVDLKDTVAGFGAKIQALETDLQALQHKNADVQQAQQANKLRLDALQSSVDTISNSSHANSTPGLQNESSLWMKNLTNRCSSGLKKVSDQLKAMNDTFSQKIKSMDDEMHDHQTKLEGLNENFANVSSHVNSIESEWPKFKQTNQQLDVSVGQINSDVINLKSNVGSLNATLRDLLTQQGNAKATSVAQKPVSCTLRLDE